MWVTMEREDRKATEASLDCRAYLDLRVQLVSRELQELLDPAARGGPLVQLDLQGRRGTSDNLDQWDHQERVESVERSDQRDLLEILAPPDPLDPQVPPRLPWRTCLEARMITKTWALRHLRSSARTRLCPIMGQRPYSRLIQGSRPH